VATGLRQVVRRGLPVTSATADPVLLNLRGVVARAVDPDDAASRTAALDGVLRGLLARLADARYADATRALFGLPPAHPGQNLTARRELAATSAGHEVHHFRKRVEPRLIDRLAAALLADADRFTRSRVIAPRLAPSPDRQLIPPDPFTWEVIEHEEALARLWGAVYALRAELLAVERLVSFEADRQQVIRQAVTAAWRWGLASAEAASYTAAFGGDANGDDVSAHDLVELAGWTPTLPPGGASALRAAAADGADRAGFVAALHDNISLGNAWVEPFLDRGQTASSPADTEGTPRDQH